jgi:hypothetical protein
MGTGSPELRLLEIQELIGRVRPLDDAAMQAARERQDQLTKTSGSKGDACSRRSWASWPSR